MSLFYLIRIDIKKEKITVEEKEQEIFPIIRKEIPPRLRAVEYNSP
jgi:hypothetical protein